jgi:hypothetical protein
MMLLLWTDNPARPGADDNGWVIPDSWYIAAVHLAAARRREAGNAAEDTGAT